MPTLSNGIYQFWVSNCDGNKNFHKEVSCKNNLITNGELDAMLSEPKECLPPDGMKTALEGALRKALRIKPTTWMT